MIGTKDNPLRASGLYRILQCPGRVVFDDREAGSAAQTGSLVHLGVVEFHKTKSLEKALAAMKLNAGDFPLADFSEATLHLTPYTKDPRNIEAEIVLFEEEVTLRLNQDLDDPYGPIFIRGHLDQLRRGADGKLYVWDIKTGKKNSGWEMLHIATLQLAAYTIGACELVNQPVYPGGIISTYGYRRRGTPPAEEKPGGVFFTCPWSLSDASTLLQPLVRRVMEVRKGEVHLIPGEHCSGCIGIDQCLPKLREYEQKN